MQEVMITVYGTQKLLEEINPSKASEPGSIPPRVFKEAAKPIAPNVSSHFPAIT